MTEENEYRCGSQCASNEILARSVRFRLVIAVAHLDKQVSDFRIVDIECLQKFITCTIRYSGAAEEMVEILVKLFTTHIVEDSLNRVEILKSNELLEKLGIIQVRQYKFG